MSEPIKLLTPKQASTYIGIKESTLAVWRVTKRWGLRYIKCGRLVKYRLSDLNSWLDSQTVQGGANM